MKKMMGLMIYGGILFGLSAGGAWFLHTKHAEELQQERAKNAPDPNALMVNPSNQQPSITSPQIPSEQQQHTLDHVPVRPEAMTPEEIVRHGFKLKKRDEAIREREQALQRVEAQYKLMISSIEGERHAIEGLMAQARQQRKAADEILARANARHQEASSLFERAGERQEETQKILDKVEQEQRNSAAPHSLPQSSIETLAAGRPSAADRDTNLKELTKVLENMKANVGAGILGEFVDDGNDDIALQLIARLEETKAAEILDEMSQKEDGSTKVKELLKKYTEMANTAPEPKKKR